MAHSPYEPGAQASNQSVGIDPAALVFVAAKRHVSAIDGHTGRVVWTTEVPGSRWYASGFMTIAADPMAVYACRPGRVTCLDPLTGQILWSIKPHGAGSTLPVVATMLGGGDAGQSSQIAAAAQAQAAAAAAASG